MLQPLIFPLNRIGVVDVMALQVSLRANALRQPTFMQQRMRAYSGALPPKVPVNMPWDAIGLPSLIDIPVTLQSTKPNVVHQLLPYTATNFKVSGITKDSTGAVLPNCIVHLFNSITDVLFLQTTSDANGYYEFRGAGPATNYYAVAYKAGAPDVAGTSVNTLTGL